MSQRPPDSPDREVPSIAPARGLPPGHLIDGRFRVLSFTRPGPPGDLYEVQDLQGQLHLSLTLFPLRFAQSPGFEKRFVQIADRLQRDLHPESARNARDHQGLEHILPVLHHGSCEDGPYLVSAFAGGEDLAAYLQRAGALNEDHARHLYRQIKWALQTAHQRGICHGDLNPAQVFLGEQYAVRVANFGLRELLGGLCPPPVPRLAAYVAPELARSLNGGHPGRLTRPADQFALAAIVYEMLRGKPAFFEPGDSLDEVLQRLRSDPERFELGRHRAEVLRRALHRSPEQRYDEVEDFIHDLDIDEVDTTVPVPRTDPRAATLIGTGSPGMHGVLRTPPRRPVLLPVSLALAVIMAATLGAIWWKRALAPRIEDLAEGTPTTPKLPRAVSAVGEAPRAPAPRPAPPAPEEQEKKLNDAGPADRKPSELPLRVDLQHEIEPPKPPKAEPPKAEPRVLQGQSKADAALITCCKVFLGGRRTYRVAFMKGRGDYVVLNLQETSEFVQENQRFIECVDGQAGSLPAGTPILITKAAGKSERPKGPPPGEALRDPFHRPAGDPKQPAQKE